MKAIVFIGSQKSGSSREAIKAAERMGYYTVLLTERPTFIQKRTEFPDVHLMLLCNIYDLDEIRKHLSQLMLKAIEISAIVSFVDPHCLTASILADELGINHFSTKAIENMQNKMRSRHLVSKTPHGPFFMVCYPGSPISKNKIKKSLPLIVKSPVSTGSKDVYKISSYKEFALCVKRLFKKYPKEPVLVEEFLDVTQFLVEAVVQEKKAVIVAMIQQEITYSNDHFIITGYDLLLDLEESFYKSMKAAVETIIQVHQLETGPCHLELRYVKNQWKLIEINPRISGAGMNRMIEIGFGIDLVEETLKLALGQEPNLNPKYQKHIFAQYVIINKTGILERIRGRKRALSCTGVQDVYIKPRKGTLLTPPHSMGNRYAYIIATGFDSTSARLNAKNASAQIEFQLLPYSDLGTGNPISAKQESFHTDLLEFYLQQFKDHMVQQGQRDETIHRSLANIVQYFQWCESYYHRKCLYCAQDSMGQYSQYLENDVKNKASTIRTKISSLKKYNQFLAAKGIFSEEDSRTASLFSNPHQEDEK